MTGKMFVDAVNVLRKVSAAVDMTEKNSRSSFFLRLEATPLSKHPVTKTTQKMVKKENPTFFAISNPRSSRIFTDFFSPNRFG